MLVRINGLQGTAMQKFHSYNCIWASRTTSIINLAKLCLGSFRTFTNCNHNEVSSACLLCRKCNSVLEILLCILVTNILRLAQIP